jgi:hypothetical protein
MYIQNNLKEIYMSTQNQKLLQEQKTRESACRHQIQERKNLFLYELTEFKLSKKVFTEIDIFHYSGKKIQEITLNFSKPENENALFKLEINYDYNNNTFEYKFETPYSNSDYSPEALSVMSESTTFLSILLNNFNATKFISLFSSLRIDLDLFKSELDDIINKKEAFLEIEYQKKEDDLSNIFNKVTKEEAEPLIDNIIYSHLIEKSQKFLTFKRNKDVLTFSTNSICMMNKNRLSLTYKGGRISKSDLYEIAHVNMLQHKNKVLNDLDDLRALGIEIKENSWNFEININDFYNHFKGIVNAINF